MRCPRVCRTSTCKVKYHKANVQSSSEIDNSNSAANQADILFYHLQQIPCHYKDKAGVCVKYVHGIGYSMDRQSRA